MNNNSEQLIAIDNFIAIIAQKTKQDSETIKEYLKQLTDCLAEGLVSDDKILIYKFGIFKKKWFDPRQGIDPNNGQQITIPGHYRISFIAAKALDDYLNQDLIADNQPKILEQNSLPTTKPMRTKLPDLEDDSDFIVTNPNACLETEILKLTSKEKSTNKSKKLFFLTVIFLLIIIIATGFIFFNIKEQHRINQVVARLNKIVNPQTHQINQLLLDQFYQENSANHTRKVVQKHRLRRGDTIYDLTIKYWQNRNLWPEMYALNINNITDPDLLKLGNSLDIYNKPNNKILSKAEKDKLIERYLLAYRIYKALGYQDLQRRKYRRGYQRRRDSVWILYIATSYENQLLKKYRQAIDPYDQKTLQKYLNLNR